MRAFILLAILLACATGCQSNQPKVQARRVPFMESQYAPYARPGSATITGQAFLKTRGGDVKFGAGNTVTLTPVTDYSTEWFMEYVLAGRPLAEPDPRIHKYLRTQIADGNGNFEFSNLPGGEYYLTCPIQWEVHGPNGLKTTGALAHAQVQVGDGQTVKALVTRDTPPTP